MVSGIIIRNPLLRFVHSLSREIHVCILCIVGGLWQQRQNGTTQRQQCHKGMRRDRVVQIHITKTIKHNTNVVLILTWLKAHLNGVTKKLI